MLGQLQAAGFGLAVQFCALTATPPILLSTPFPPEPSRQPSADEYGRKGEGVRAAREAAFMRHVSSRRGLVMDPSHT